ncbi:MAG: TMEM43 family protein [Campylobacterota bacterium]|nr:TMEM43 family protein [Campylobacterota bacterium]
MDHYTETTRTSYGQNIGNSFKGIIGGLIFVVVSIGLLWWNEGRSVDQASALKEMQTNIVTLPNTNYDAQYNNNAVLLQGEVKPNGVVQDPHFGIKSPVLVLSRNVQMYQWQENKTTHSEDKMGGSTETTTTYDYVKVWSSQEISSSSFKYPQGHHNPTMAYKSERYISDAKMGDFYLSKNIVGHFTPNESFGDLSSLPQQIGEVDNHQSFLYKGLNPNDPQIGDIKITYSYAGGGEYSIAAKLNSQNVVAYNTQNGKSFVFVRSGIVSSDAIFKEEFQANAILTWVLRFVGLLVMFIGFNMILGPLVAIANVVPFIGSLIGAGTGLISAALTFIIGSLVIALAWFASRPLLSLVIIAVGVAIALLLSMKSKQKASAMGSTSPPSQRSKEDKEAPTMQETPPPNSTTTPPPRR